MCQKNAMSSSVRYKRPGPSRASSSMLLSVDKRLFAVTGRPAAARAARMRKGVAARLERVAARLWQRVAVRLWQRVAARLWQRVAARPRQGVAACL
jgi:hypothetical protein